MPYLQIANYIIGLEIRHRVSKLFKGSKLIIRVGVKSSAQSSGRKIYYVIVNLPQLASETMSLESRSNSLLSSSSFLSFLLTP